jgi:hypothetical protein
MTQVIIQHLENYWIIFQYKILTKIIMPEIPYNIQILYSASCLFKLRRISKDDSERK